MNVLEAIQKRRSIRHYKPDDIPEDVRAPMAIVLGYPVAWPEPRPRKSLDEIICYDKYSQNTGNSYVRVIKAVQAGM